MIAHLAAFAGVAALVIVTPGQDTALTIRNTLLGDLLRRGPARRVLDAVTGTVLIGLGVRLATSER